MLLVMGAYVIGPASLLPVVLSDLDVSEGVAAALVSMPQVSATLLGLPVGVYLDRVRTRGAVPAAGGLLCLGSLGDWAAAAAGDVRLLVASRLVAGVGMFVLWVVGTNVVSGAFPPGRRATATSVFVTGYPTGYAFGQVAAPVIAGAFGWPTVFPAFGVAVAITSTGFFVIARRVVPVETTGPGPGRVEIGRVLSDRNVWAVAALSFLVYSLYMVFNSWMPTYLSRRFGVSLVESGLVAALFPAVGILSRPAGGWASDGPFGRRRRPVFAVAFGGAVVLAAALWATATVALLVVGLVVAGFFIQFPIGVLYQYVQEFVEADVAGTAISLVSVTGWLGSFVAPVVLGVLIDASGEVAVAFTFAAVLGIVGLIATGVTGESAGRSTAT